MTLEGFKTLQVVVDAEVAAVLRIGLGSVEASVVVLKIGLSFAFLAPSWRALESYVTLSGPLFEDP